MCVKVLAHGRAAGTISEALSKVVWVERGTQWVGKAQSAWLPQGFERWKRTSFYLPLLLEQNWFT